MKADGNIDDLFRQGLGEKEYSPPMHLWPGVAQRLPKPFLSPGRAGRLVLFAFILGILLHRDGQMINWNKDTGAPPLPAAEINSPSNFQTRSAPPSDQAAIDAGTSRLKGNPPEAAVPGKAPRRRTRPIWPTPAGGQTTVLPLTGQGQDLEVSPEPGAAALQAENSATLEKPREKRPAAIELPLVAKRSTPFFPMPLEDAVPPVKFLGERWFAGVDFSYSNDWMQRNLYAKNPGDEPYVFLRNSTEALRSANTASLRLSLIAASGITLRGGIQVARFNELFSHSTEKQEIQYIPRRDAGGLVIGTDTVFQTVRTTNGQMNRFQTIDIPLTLGFEFPVGRANLGIHAGPVLNMAFYQRGKFLAEDGERIVDFSSSTPDAYPAFRNRLGMGFYGSINISYPLTPSLHLFAEPYLRVFPGAVTTADYPLEQRYRTQGVFIGVRKMMGPYWMNLRP
jgi:hypothetical protein